MRATIAFFLALGASFGCAAQSQQSPRYEQSRHAFSGDKPPLPKAQRWERGQAAMQGFFGVSYLDTIALEGGASDISIDSDELENFPLIGGGGQWKFWGDSIDFGLEGMFSSAWRTDSLAFAAGGGGAVIALDVDLVFIDLFGGPFVNVFVGDAFRVYAAAGPVMQFVEYDQDEHVSGAEDNTSGFGVGGYARTGFEFRLPNGYTLGLGWRMVRTDVDLEASFGDFDADATQVFVTVTSWF